MLFSQDKTQSLQNELTSLLVKSLIKNGSFQRREWQR